VTTSESLEAPIAASRTSPPTYNSVAARIEHDEILAADGHLIQQMSFRDVADDGADLAIELDLDPRLTNPRGGLQGGLLATLVDVVAGRAVLDGGPSGYQVVTADLTIHFLRALNQGPARGRAHVVHRGRRRAVVDVDVVDMGSGEVAATCCVAFSVFPTKASGGEAPAAEGAGT